MKDKCAAKITLAEVNVASPLGLLPPRTDAGFFFLHINLDSAIIALMTEVLYRKYRPKTFKEMLGQDHITSVLEGSIKQGNIAHAYLFSGSRGTGKTSMARIFAKSAGVSAKDLYEIDAASNRGIDDIRELREGVNTLPFDSPYKVYIIDEAHMLTKEAFNALLKTLEEPPAHALFILATTEFEKLPDTIVSRCQSFTFKKPSQTILKNMILNIAKKEGFELEPAACELITYLADGSFRDAHGVLQKIISISTDKKVSVEEVEKVTGAPAGTLVNECLSAIDENKLDDALDSINKSSESGGDAKIFLGLLLHKVRSVMLLRFAKELKATIEEQFSESDFKLLSTLSQKKDSNINSTLLKSLLEASINIGYANTPSLPLEIALIEHIETV